MARYLQAKTGSYTGTGAAVTIKLNFKPKRVEVVNETDGTRYGFALDVSPAGYSYDDSTSGSHLTDLSTQTTNGFTFGPEGFTIGTLYSTSAKVYRWFAIG